MAEAILSGRETLNKIAAEEAEKTAVEKMVQQEEKEAAAEVKG